MATAYSTLLGLALPVQGELSGTWGDMVDNGITRYVDIAVAGTVTLTNDGAVTLSLTNGDSSATNIVSSLTGAGTVSAQFAIIKVTGTLTTAKVLTPPSSSRTYVVVNAATGSTVTVKASGQTGVSIAVGETAFVYFNGTDYVKVAGTVNTGVTSFQTSLSGLTPSTSTTGAVTLAGTLGTSSGGTGLTSFTSGGVVYASSSSALATGSALTFDGTRLSTSGLNLTTSSGTANTILMTGSGTAAVYTQYQNTGGNFYVGRDNSAGNLFGSSYASFLYATGAYPMIFLTNDAERLRITSAGDVGIGTSSPVVKLDVIGKIRTAPSSGAAEVAVRSPSGSSNFISWSEASVADRAAIGFANGSGNLQFRMGGYDMSTGTQSMTLDSSGNLGLGVTPSAWRTNGSDRALQVGPRNCLFTDSGLSAEVGNNVYLGSSGFTYVASATASRYRQYLGAHEFFTAASGTAGNAISFTQAMTLDSSGNLGIGATSPQTQLEILGVPITNNDATRNVIIRTSNTSAINNGGGIAFGGYYDGTTSSVNDFAGIQGFKENATAGNYAGGLRFTTRVNGGNPTERARISSTGGFSVGTTADPGAGAIYATGNITAYYSDARLKTVSGKIENALDKVAQLSGVYYTNNAVAKSFGYDSDEVQVGVLAQDVEAVLPQIVKAAPFDLDQDGNSKSGENYKTVQYERLVPLLIEAINELQAKVKALEAK